MQKSLVVCIDEKTQTQALDRTAPILPLRPGIPEKQTRDYKRNGTTLFGALQVATGLVIDRCFQQDTNVEFLALLKQVAKSLPPGPDARGVRELRQAQALERQGVAGEEPPCPAVLHPDQLVLAVHGRDLPRDHPPPSPPLRAFHSVADLETAIASYIAGWNERAHLFTWTKSADEIIFHAKPSLRQKKTYNTRH